MPLIHDIQNILNIVPEAGPLLKKASIWGDLPTDTPVNVAASLVHMTYLEKVAGVTVDYFKESLVKEAADAYGFTSDRSELKPILTKLASYNSTCLEKSASSVRKDDVLNKINSTDNYLEKVSMCVDTVSAGLSGILTEQQRMYGVDGYTLDKQACVKALNTRYAMTYDKGYLEKSAQIDKLSNESILAAPRESLVKFAASVVQQDVDNDLLAYSNADFIKECFIKKAAASDGIMINLAGKDVPMVKVMRFGKDRIGSAIGKDVSAGLTGDMSTDKQVLSTLPRDLQAVLLRHIESF